MFKIINWLRLLERDLISQRTKERLASAEARGGHGGRPCKRNEKSDLVFLLLDQNYIISEIVRKTGFSRSTIYRVIIDKE